MMKYSVERKEKREEAGWNYVVFESEKERADWLKRNCDEIDGIWLTFKHNDEVRLHDFETNNAEEVLQRVEECISILEESKYRKNFAMTEVCHELSIFDWWRDTLSKSQLKKMKGFLEEAIKLGYTGYVCFKVGASGCANGMWAHKEETKTGYSPSDSEFLYRSFTPDYTCWEVRAADGKTYPTGEQWNTIKTKKQLEELVKQINTNTVPTRPALKVTYLRDGEEFTDTTESEITFEDGRVCFKTMYFNYRLEAVNVVKIESIQL